MQNIYYMQLVKMVLKVSEKMVSIQDIIKLADLVQALILVIIRGNAKGIDKIVQITEIIIACSFA
jgi:hypothetical protein